MRLDRGLDLPEGAVARWYAAAHADSVASCRCSHGGSPGSRDGARAGRGDAAREDLVLDAPGWPGHHAGQHVDVRLTRRDGYQAQRSYSIASAPEDERLC